MGIDRRGEGGRVGIDTGEWDGRGSVDRHEWEGRRRAGIESRVGGGEWGYIGGVGRGREWG